MANAIQAIGDIVRVRQYRGWEIAQRVSWVGYAQNGNAHNPTHYYEWDVRKAGQGQFTTKTMREAKEAIDFLA